MSCEFETLRESLVKRSSQRNSNQKIESSSSQKRNINGKHVNSKFNNCTRYGQIHKFKCPALAAFGVQWNNCINYNHFAKFCKYRSVKLVSIESNNISESDKLFVGTVFTISSNSSQTKHGKLICILIIFL